MQMPQIWLKAIKKAGKWFLLPSEKQLNLNLGNFEFRFGLLLKIDICSDMKADDQFGLLILVTMKFVARPNRLICFLFVTHFELKPLFEKLIWFVVLQELTSGPILHIETHSEIYNRWKLKR